MVLGFSLLRKRIAKRISTVKGRAGLQTPIINEVPLKAQVRALEFPLAETGGIIPVIVPGTAYGEIAGRWYRVDFPRVIINPRVVCVAQARKGEVPKPVLQELNLPEWVEIKIPELDLPHVREAIGRFIVECPWPMTGPCDDLEKALNAMVEIVEAGLKRLNQIIDKVDDRLEEIRSNLIAVSKRIDELRDNTVEGVNKLMAGVFPQLYDSWGLRQDIALTIANIRNVTTTGFEFLSMGQTTIHYIAMGSRR